MKELYVDPKRWPSYQEQFGTGFFVRTKIAGHWENVDICVLTRESLLDWLRSRGGDNLWAENVVLMLLGHEPLD